MRQNEWKDFIDDRSMSDYEKRRKKQKLIRNEFPTVGRYGMPLVRKQSVDIDKIEPWGYAKTKQNDEVNGHKTIHFCL